MVVQLNFQAKPLSRRGLRVKHIQDVVISTKNILYIVVMRQILFLKKRYFFLFYKEKFTKKIIRLYLVNAILF